MAAQAADRVAAAEDRLVADRAAEDRAVATAGGTAAATAAAMAAATAGGEVGLRFGRTRQYFGPFG